MKSITTQEGTGSMYKSRNTMPNAANYCLILLVIVSSAIVFWGLAVISAKCFGFVLTNDQIVSTIIGILATFVVVSNYIQVQEVKRDLELKIEELKVQQTNIENVRETDERYFQLWSEAVSDKVSVTLATHLLENPNQEFNVVTADTPERNGETLNAKWRFSADNKLEFYTMDDSQKTLKHIMMVDDYEYNRKYVECLLKILLKKQQTSQSPKAQEVKYNNKTL